MIQPNIRKCNKRDFLKFVISVKGGHVFLVPRIKQHSYANAPISIAWCCYVSRRTLTPLPLWLQKHNNRRAHEFAHFPNLRHQSKLANIICVWSCRLYGITLQIVFCDTKSCSLLGMYRGFENTCYLNLTRSLQWKQYVPMQRQQISTSLRGTTSKTTIFFTSIVVKTSSIANRNDIKFTINCITLRDQAPVMAAVYGQDRMYIL